MLLGGGNLPIQKIVFSLFLCCELLASEQPKSLPTNKVRLFTQEVHFQNSELAAKWQKSFPPMAGSKSGRGHFFKYGEYLFCTREPEKDFHCAVYLDFTDEVASQVMREIPTTAKATSLKESSAKAR